MKITFYTIDCPQCMGIEARLKAKKIEYDVNKDKDEMISKGFTSSPTIVTENGDVYMGAKACNEFLKGV